MPRRLRLISLMFLAAFIFASAGHAQTHAIDGEFITEWLLLGPFPSAELDRDFLASVGGEATVHSKEGDSVITASGDTLKWKRYRSIGSIIDLDHAVGDYDGVTLYAFCILQSETEERAQFLLGSNDDVAVWINGKQVHRHREGREVLADQDLFNADLKAGENRCLVKVTEGTGTWGFALRAYPYDRPVDAVPKVGWWASSLKHSTKAYGWLTPNWKYHPGDDPDWAKPEFDDRSWETTNTWFQPINPPKSGWNGIGWFRLHLAVDSTLWNRPLALNVDRLRGASEIYLDGTLLAQFGKVGSSQRDEEGYFKRNNFPPPQYIVFRRTNHIIAVRFSNFLFTKNYPHASQGFEMSFGDLSSEIAKTARLKRFMANTQILLTVVPMVFGLLHLLLFLFYRRAKENLYYAAFTLTFGVAVFLVLEYEFSFVTNLRQAVFVIDITDETVVFAFIAGLRFLYAVFYPRLPKQFWLFLLLAIVLCVWLWNRPFFTDEKYLTLFIMITLVEMLRVTVVAMLKKKDGAWIIGIGFLFFIVGGLSIFLPDLGILSMSMMPTIAVFSLGLFGLLLSMSVFLARNFAQTNKNLEAQLIQVKALSEKTIQQEREKAQLEAENARKTKELEEARQLQLSMLPKNPPALPHLDIAAEMKTATEVGGDYYDFKVHDDGVLTIAVGDATGHGMQAGTMIAATKSLFNP